jgi:hypothetical protein
MQSETIDVPEDAEVEITERDGEVEVSWKVERQVLVLEDNANNVKYIDPTMDFTINESDFDDGGYRGQCDYELCADELFVVGGTSDTLNRECDTSDEHHCGWFFNDMYLDTIEIE